MTSLPQELDDSGNTSLLSCLNYSLENGAAHHVKVKWGKSERYVIVIEGKQYQYSGGHNINKNLGKKIKALYISMSDKSSNKKQNTDSINVSLEFDDDGDRTWINKNRFDEFESDYQQS